MRQPLLPYLIALLVLLVGPAANAARTDTVAFRWNIPDARMPPQPIPAVLEVPDGNGPFPAIIVLHGCGGRGRGQEVWAQRLNSWGYVALIPDSFAPRGVFGGVCAPDRLSLVTIQDRAGDVLSAALGCAASRRSTQGGSV